jgi:hypothetical protein
MPFMERDRGGGWRGVSHIEYHGMHIPGHGQALWKPSASPSVVVQFEYSEMKVSDGADGHVEHPNHNAGQHDQ